MRIHRLLMALAVVTALRLPSVAAQEPLVNVRLVATDTLRDLAVTTMVAGRPVIYFNPVLLQSVGEPLRDFFVAHEYGHVAHGHTGGALTSTGDELAKVRQKQELQADCYAASRLARTNPVAVDAAVAFFSRMGPFRYDQLHPSGAQRAANILACVAAEHATGEEQN